MPKYTSPQDVEVRLRGKVRFGDDDDDTRTMSRRLLNRLINEAEGQVERDLAPRYFSPFQSIDPSNSSATLGPESFNKLPDTTKETLRTMCELMSVIRVLETDFGSGSANDAKSYRKNQQDRYDAMVKREVGKREGMEDAPGEWLNPSLKGLYLADHAPTDDGTYGAILVTSRGEGDFPAERITDPSESFLNGRWRG